MSEAEILRDELEQQWVAQNRTNQLTGYAQSFEMFLILLLDAERERYESLEDQFNRYMESHP